MSVAAPGTAPGTSWYNAVWRWHVYAGLFCLPFVLWLSVTGTLYLWKPQVEAWQERAYDRLLTGGAVARPEAIVAAALAARPGRLKAYQLPAARGRAARVLVDADGAVTRVYVDPHDARVLGRVVDADRLMPTVSRLHGNLLIGAPGSWLVEIAACWTITMLLTGLYLWWPRTRSGRGRKSLAGILYPRWRGGKRLFWRDTHAIAGLWVSAAALFLVATGLPWANAWGNYLVAIRAATGTADGPADWMKGAAPVEHAGHATTMVMPEPSTGRTPGELDRVVAAAIPLGVPAPVMVAPPAPGGRGWVVTSDTANRPQRTRVVIEGPTGRILERRDFAQRQWIDRAVGYGIAIHEGAFFGLANQLLGTLVTALLMTLTVSGTVMWWRRRRPGTIGLPLRLCRPRYGWGLVGTIGLLGVAMPLFGTTLLAVLALDRLAARR